ncbi:MAG: cation diffusion facilitator family transporter [Candidatus Omnitrophica bacterium]|nr:cation diffusion facilitator family transporter [Candidatus Omnitrophota bacterium]MCM8809557.1 cation diffusion facilitator family transporter [Candidatus Omnitrophota bacterium]MCM8833083.1 cation diffusion facilitator family transporter [Candidatus Omnitrophota bacterium]
MNINQLILKKLIKNKKEVPREFFGYIEAWISILGNLFLFMVKFLTGILTKSISIITEAFHSLSDILTSILVIYGFKLSKKPPDEKHPFGHGRIEQIGTLIIAFLLLFASINFIKISIARIKNPIEIQPSIFIIIFMFFSGFFKEWMTKFSFFLGKKINSDLLIADAWHHRLDSIASFIVGIGLILIRFGIHKVDGIIGILVVLLLLWISFDLIRKTTSFLIGEAPDEKTIEQIKKIISLNPDILNSHDIRVHDYGNKKVISLHIEVKKNMSLKQAHDIALKIQDKIKNQIINSEVSVHIDPIGERDD